MNSIRIILLACAVAASLPALTACARTSEKSAAVTDTAVAAEANALPLPEVPDSIFDPVDRADYIVLHYWDQLSPADPRCNDREFMDASFAKYADSFIYASDYGASYAVTTLIQQLSKYPEQLSLMTDLARKHFFTKGSATYSEGAFALWVREALDAGFLSQSDKSRYKFLLNAAEKNAVGTKAADFRYTDRRGNSGSLYSLASAPYTLLMFYDPDCEDCQEVIATLRGNSDLRKAVRGGQVRILLVDVAGDQEEFARFAANLPAEWTVALDTDGIEDRDIYIFDSTPAIYLLDGKKTVLLKDATVQDLVDYAQAHIQI